MSAYSIATRGLAGRKVPQGVLATMDELLFSGSEQGAWYDPSDMSTLFQDSVGTVPVTAVEQPVGRILDKSGRGNHATQATTTKRPVLSRRVNLLTKTEQFEDATWLKSSNGVVLLGLNAAISPSGTGNATKVIAHTNTAIQAVYVNGVNGVPAKTARVFAKKAEYKYARIFNGGGDVVVFDLESGAKVSQIGTSIVNASSQDFGDGWWLLSATLTRLDSSYLGFGPSVSTSGNPFAGDGVSGIYMWGASITLATDAHLPYQWVNTPTDYDADPAKFPAYLRFEVDDALQTGNIDFTGTDKMTVWAGVTKLSDAARSCIVELGNGGVDSSSIMYINAPGITPSTDKFSFAAIGPAAAASLAIATGADLNSPINAIACGTYTPGESSKLRLNGVQRGVAQNINPAGNFLARPLYIGARAGTSLYFNGRLYGLIVRGAQSTLSQIEATEAYIKQKMRLP